MNEHGMPALYRAMTPAERAREIVGKCLHTALPREGRAQRGACESCIAASLVAWAAQTRALVETLEGLTKERDHALAMEDRSHRLRNQAQDWCERLRQCVARLAALRSKKMSAAQCETYGMPFTTEVADANRAYAETWRAIDALFEEQARAALIDAPLEPADG